MKPYLAELIGTALLILFGNGVVANVVLDKTKGNNSSWIVISFGWAMAVYIAVFIAAPYSKAHLNPAVTLAFAFVGKLEWAKVPIYLTAQMLGAMIGAGIHNGDVVIVDRSLEVKNGKVIIAVLDGEMLIRRLEINNGKKRLLPATKKLSSIEINDSNVFSVWGVVTYVIHSV